MLYRRSLHFHVSIQTEKFNTGIKNIFDFTTAGELVCVAVVKHLPALHYSEHFIFMSFWIMDSVVELQNH